MKPYHETWEANRYVIELAGDNGHSVAQFIDDDGNAEPPSIDRDRALLAAQAPRMARLLIQVLNRVKDPLADEIANTLHAAGVIRIQRGTITL